MWHMETTEYWVVLLPSKIALCSTRQSVLRPSLKLQKKPDHESMISENPESFWSTYHLIHIPTENEVFLHLRSVCEALEQARGVCSPISWANHLPMLNPTFIFPLQSFTKNLFALRIDSRQCFSSIFPGESVFPLSFSPPLVTSGWDLSRVKHFTFGTWCEIYFAAGTAYHSPRNGIDRVLWVEHLHGKYCFHTLSEELAYCTVHNHLRQLSVKHISELLNKHA